MYDPKRKPREVPSIKAIARMRLKAAVRTGKVNKPNKCEVCGLEHEIRHIHGHHWHGYESPLDVQWLCYRCHGRTERKYVTDRRNEPAVLLF